MGLSIDAFAKHSLDFSQRLDLPDLPLVTITDEPVSATLFPGTSVAFFHNGNEPWKLLDQRCQARDSADCRSPVSRSLRIFQ